MAGLIFNCSLALPHKCYTFLKTPDGESIIFKLLSPEGAPRQIFGTTVADCQCERSDDHYAWDRIVNYRVPAVSTFTLSIVYLRRLLKYSIRSNNDIVLAKNRFLDWHIAFMLASDLGLIRLH